MKQKNASPTKEQTQILQRNKKNPASVGDASNAVANMAHTLYSAYRNDNPMLAVAFKELLMSELTDEDSFVWTADALMEGEFQDMKTTYGEDEGCEG